MRDGWQQRTQANLLRYFDEPGLDVAVVGNGPISRADRAAIGKAARVIRFNDVNNFWEGEKTTLRVVRHPSWFTLKHVGAPKWHVSPTDNLAPNDAELVTGVYERQHGNDNILPASSQLFPSCFCGPSCLQATTWAGPSTGGVALSVLQDINNIATIDVYGMNWNGPADMHIDFANGTIVEACCTKCVVHPTASDSYGAAFFATSVGIVTIGGMVAFFLTGGTVAARKLLHHRSPDHETPLLGMKHPA
jgi:hypothetical protein